MQNLEELSSYENWKGKSEWICIVKIFYAYLYLEVLFSVFSISIRLLCILTSCHSATFLTLTWTQRLHTPNDSATVCINSTYKSDVVLEWGIWRIEMFSHE